MLTLWRRHKSTCSHRADRYFRKCHCAVWCEGTVESKYIRKSLKTRSWERGGELAREIEAGSRAEKPRIVTINDALNAFIADCEARALNPSTLRKYNTLRDTFSQFARSRNLAELGRVETEDLRQFRGTRHVSPRTASKELERLRAFFRYCQDNDWIIRNPARSIKAPQVKDNPTLPLSDAEVAKILANADFRTQVFFRVLLHSGLRIIDAAQLRPEKIIAGKVFLYSQKTGVPVMCPLPPDLLSDLSKLTLTGGFYFAVQSAHPISIAEYYRQKLNKAAIAAGLGKKKEPGSPRGKNIVHPHRFRDTFAVRLLEKGVSLETVSILLGHTDIQTTPKSYAPWVASLQANLELAVQKTWSSKLVRVK